MPNYLSCEKSQRCNARVSYAQPPIPLEGDDDALPVPLDVAMAGDDDDSAFDDNGDEDMGDQDDDFELNNLVPEED